MCAVVNASNLIPQECGLQFPPAGIDELPAILKPSSEGGILEHSGTVEVVASEKRDKTPVERDLRWGVYIVFQAPTDYVRRCFSEYGLRTDYSGGYSAMYRPYHLIGLELGISIASAVLRHEPTGSPQSFVADVASVAKKDMAAGDMLDGEGGFTVYGRLTRADESIENRYLPIGLTNKARLTRAVAKGSILTYKDVEVNNTLLCYRLRRMIEQEFKGFVGDLNL
jgi:predicted homoserine dehydrogenase-like protein